MPDVNDPNGAKDPLPRQENLFNGPYGWIPILIVTLIMAGVFALMPVTENPTVKISEKPVYRADAPN